MSTAFGRFNVVTGSTTSWVTTDPLFVVGNGTGSGASSNNALTLYKNGNLNISGTYSSSDIKLKEKIEEMGEALPVLKQLKPIYFEFKNKEIYPNTRQIGFIAQDIAKYYPEMVLKAGNGMLSIDYSKMTVILVQAINEQQQIIETQQKENDELKKQIEEINRKLDMILTK
jgi:hypothetical protein